MFIRNIHPPQTHGNGMRYILEYMSANLPLLRIFQVPNAGNRLCLPRMPFESGKSTFPFLALHDSNFQLENALQ